MGISFPAVRIARNELWRDLFRCSSAHGSALGLSPENDLRNGLIAKTALAMMVFRVRRFRVPYNFQQ
jgi:hypothetical protein